MLKRIMSIFEPNKSISCPHCLAKIVYRSSIRTCPNNECNEIIPPLYQENYSSHPPLFIPIIGWSNVGKTVYLNSLSIMLSHLSKMFSNYFVTPANEVSLQMFRNSNEFIKTGRLPAVTQLTPQDAVIFLLSKLPRWKSRSLVFRDCAGEVFNSFDINIDFTPYLPHSSIAMMFFSLTDNDQNIGIDMLLNRYIHTLFMLEKSPREFPRNVIVVVTKGDLIEDMPSSIKHYLVNDPIWVRLNKSKPDFISISDLENYLQIMNNINEEIRKWFASFPSGSNFINMANFYNINLKFSIISSTGQEINTDEVIPMITPQRVLDPLFWALETSSSDNLDK